MTSPAIHFARTDAEQRRLSARARRGELQRVAPRIYADLTDDVPALVRLHLLQILAFRYPGAVLAHRSALRLAAENDEVWLITPQSQRNDRLGGITIHLLTGDREQGVDVIPPHLGVMSLERVLLESLVDREGRGLDKYLTRAECEHELLKLLARSERVLNDLRDRARELAGKLDLMPAFETLSTMISALLQTHEADGVLTSEPARAQARGEPFDEACLARCKALHDYLSDMNFPDRTQAYAKSHWRSLAFFEAYFSNYIEGTELTVDEAEAVVFQGRDLPARSGDSRDVRGTFEICSDYTEMRVTPNCVQALITLLKDRHRVMLGGRPEHAPGEFKTRANRAGSTEFVQPDAVIGTLTRGFDFYASLAPGMPRALLMHFLLTDVHPMSDGNGRLSRLMMNAELVSAGQSKIIVPTVARDDYLNGQRMATRDRNFRIMCKMLTELHGYTASLPADDYAALLARLEEDHALKLPDDGLPRFSRARARFRFEPEAPSAGPAP